MNRFMHNVVEITFILVLIIFIFLLTYEALQYSQNKQKIKDNQTTKIENFLLDIGESTEVDQVNIKVPSIRLQKKSVSDNGLLIISIEVLNNRSYSIHTSLQDFTLIDQNQHEIPIQVNENDGNYIGEVPKLTRFTTDIYFKAQLDKNYKLIYKPKFFTHDQKIQWIINL